MTRGIQVRIEPPDDPNAETIRRAADAALVDQGIDTGQLSIVLTDVGTIQELNRQFSKLDQPTDVLAFPAGHQDPEFGAIDHGDVIVCLPIARAQAAQRGHGLEEELTLLTIHGVLHLMGHDHAEAEERRRMIEAQRRILGNLGSDLKPDLDEP